MKVAILGGGNGGHAMAAHLSIRGHEISFFELPEFEESIAAAKSKGGIKVTGFPAKQQKQKEIFVEISNVTSNIKEAMKGAKVIMVVVPSFAHEVFIKHFAEYLEDGQIVVFHAGKLASILCLKILKDMNIKKEITVAETSTLPYGCRLQGPSKIFIKSIKYKLRFSACPAIRNKEAIEVLNGVFSEFYAGKNVFDLFSCGPVLHPISTLLNASRIEQMGPYKNSHYDVTPSIGRVLDLADAERVAVCNNLGVDATPCKDMLTEYYEAKGTNMYETLMDCYSYKIQTSPNSLKFRYVTEDVPYGMVLIASLGKLIEVPTPVINTMIKLATYLNDEDYWKIGRTADKLGISGLTKNQIIEFVTNGNI